MASNSIVITFIESAANLALERSSELRAELHRMGARGVQYGAGIAPVDSGDYRDSFVSTVGHDQQGRPVLCIANTDFKTWWIEVGTAGTPAHHVLNKVLDHVRQ